MRIFVDANVIVAVLNRQYPLFPYAARILSLSDNPGYTIYTSPICLAIAFYFAEKKSGTLQAKSKVAVLSEKLEITTTDMDAVRSTVENTAIHDFEDGLEYYAALRSACEMIISEDVSDFYFSEIPVQNCETFLKYI
ncbi:PIN domain-containing protein [Sphingobacterium pedocola]|uniref:Twitching motility protein PilT n=1 Tax=Sphingobacterium pedocola TaxID=2082722 RepID=A0ABR9T4C8_9SPHI|nr:PIN domain-containing protein [Sphingobacterium pedocola]MBE8719754.1 twitching motility protein PilT [Sphingobacterium pedocola]